MKCLAKLEKTIQCSRRKQMMDHHKNFAVFAVLGVAIGAVVVLFTQSCSKEIRSLVIRNAKDIEEDVNIKRDEIKETLESVADESMGDVGVAMEKALDDLEVHSGNDTEVTK